MNSPGGIKWLSVPSTSSTVEVEGNFSVYITARYCSNEPEEKRSLQRNETWEK